MLTSWRYRVTSVVGVAAIVISSVYVSNLPFFQTVLTTYVPIVNNLDPIVLDGEGLKWALLISSLIVLGAFTRLFRPEPRRTLDILFAVEQRVLFSVFAMATLGYFKWSHRLPRQTVILTALLLGVTLPIFFMLITRSPITEAKRAIVVGNDPLAVERIAESYEGPLLGYVAPPTPYQTNEDATGAGITDGGEASFELGYIGGLSRLDDTIREHNVDSAILAFDQVDRREFFGALHTCHEHGIDAKTHVDNADSVLVSRSGATNSIVNIDIDPWDVQDRLFKRLFDIAFASIALVVLSPVILTIAAAIRIEGHGPILFKQDRTYRFGETFSVFKFRTLKPMPEEEVGTEFDKSRQTQLGDFLRTTHLDEIPQLWSILAGDMSVVGPRPAQTELENDFESEAETWKRRWFVKPGLTGLAQINDATSQNPAEKIDYDVEYIRSQSLTLDMKIVLRQLWQVVQDVVALQNR